MAKSVGCSVGLGIATKSLFLKMLAKDGRYTALLGLQDICYEPLAYK